MTNALMIDKLVDKTHTHKMHQSNSDKLQNGICYNGCKKIIQETNTKRKKVNRHNGSIQFTNYVNGQREILLIELISD